MRCAPRPSSARALVWLLLGPCCVGAFQPTQAASGEGFGLAIAIQVLLLGMLGVLGVLLFRLIRVLSLIEARLARRDRVEHDRAGHVGDGERAHAAAAGVAQAATAPPVTRESLLEQVAASRAANDPDTVLALHGQLITLMDGEERARLDRELMSWFMSLLMKRMRGGTVRTDVAVLAARLVERFPATSEGAALRASLPTLRRSAGLCPVCAEVYQGVEDACPDCLARAAESTPQTLTLRVAPEPHTEEAPGERAGLEPC